MATVIEREMPAGSHSVSFDARVLSRGTCFYDLRVNGHHDMKKLTILR